MGGGTRCSWVGLAAHTELRTCTGPCTGRFKASLGMLVPQCRACKASTSRTCRQHTASAFYSTCALSKVGVVLYLRGLPALPRGPGRGLQRGFIFLVAGGVCKRQYFPACFKCKTSERSSLPPLVCFRELVNAQA